MTGDRVIFMLVIPAGLAIAAFNDAMVSALQMFSLPTISDRYRPWLRAVFVVFGLGLAIGGAVSLMWGSGL